MSIKEAQMRNTMMQNCMILIGTRGSPKFPNANAKVWHVHPIRLKLFIFFTRNQREGHEKPKRKKGQNKLHIKKVKYTSFKSPSKSSLKLPKARKPELKNIFHRGKGHFSNERRCLFLSQNIFSSIVKPAWYCLSYIPKRYFIKK